jgi:hypothetical protein
MLWVHPPVAAQTVKYIDGLFIHDGKQATELIAWAEITGRGQLTMSRGSLEDAPTIHVINRIMVSIPLWKPVGAFVASTALFQDDQAERRNMSMAARKLNIYAMEVRVSDLESRDKIDSMLRSVRASQDSPGYAFIVLSGGDYQRFYPIRLTPVER